MPQLIEKIKRFYMTFDPGSLAELDEIYAQNVTFVDPVHTVEGIDALRSYFSASMEGLASCKFDFKRQLVSDAEALLEWQMIYCHPRLKGGKAIHLDGVSIVQFDDKVTHHRDYYDLGQMVYEHVPVMRSVIKFVKQKIAR